MRAAFITPPEGTSLRTALRIVYGAAVASGIPTDYIICTRGNQLSVPSLSDNETVELRRLMRLRAGYKTEFTDMD